jgi:hypothetical protein
MVFLKEERKGSGHNICKAKFSDIVKSKILEKLILRKG